MKITIFIFSFLFLFNSFSMCEYPHNPPVVCVEGTVLKSTSVMSKNYKCVLTVKVKKIFRPANTYIFNSNLERVDYKKPKNLMLPEVEIYSKKSCEAKAIKTVAEYNCNDRNSDIADMALLDAGSIQLKVRDPWTEKNPQIDCRSLLSK